MIMCNIWIYIFGFAIFILDTWIGIESDWLLRKIRDINYSHIPLEIHLTTYGNVIEMVADYRIQSEPSSVALVYPQSKM